MNSANQRWSKWEIRATQTVRVVPYAVFKVNVARFARKVYGSATQIRILERRLDWEVQVLTEGHPVHDPEYVAYVRALWTRFFIEGLGPSTEVTLSARLVAGSRQDGTPSDQVILMPSLASLIAEELK